MYFYLQSLVILAADKGNKSTVGVDVSDWIYGKKLQIKFSTWDFAGQVCMKDLSLSSKHQKVYFYNL